MTKEKSKKPAKLPPNKVGRPTSYKPEYCQLLLEHVCKGLSFESFGATIGVARDRVFEWAHMHPEFADAKKRAQDESLLWWESQAIDGLRGDRNAPFNSAVWIFNMKNRHGWRDNRDVTLQADIKVSQVRQELAAKTTEELLDIINETKPQEISDDKSN